MKTLIFALSLLGLALISSCSSAKMNGAHQSSKDVDDLKSHDFHANTANKIIDENAKNKKLNSQTARRAQESQQVQMNELNKNTSKAKKVAHKNVFSNNTAFNFY